MTNIFVGGVATSGQLSISNSLFIGGKGLLLEGNTWGGSIYASGAAVTIEGTYFEDLTTPASGAAILAASNSAVTVFTTTFSNNSAAVNGGAILVCRRGGPNLVLKVT